MPETTVVCPSCGTVSSTSRSGVHNPTSYSQNPPSSYSQGYGPQHQQQQFYPPSQPEYQSQPGYASQPGYGQPYNAMYPQPQVAVNINMTMPTTQPTSAGNTGAIIVEVLLNLFLGIYGVGWLMAGETTTGIILLICSILLYWPILILGTIFTLGIGLICIGPLAIGAVILNVIHLNNTIKRKTAYVLVQPVQTFPPR
jgi:hypothetical protein